MRWSDHFDGVYAGPWALLHLLKRTLAPQREGKRVSFLLHQISMNSLVNTRRYGVRGWSDISHDSSVISRIGYLNVIGSNPLLLSTSYTRNSLIPFILQWIDRVVRRSIAAISVCLLLLFFLLHFSERCHRVCIGSIAAWRRIGNIKYSYAN